MFLYSTYCCDHVFLVRVLGCYAVFFYDSYLYSNHDYFSIGHDNVSVFVHVNLYCDMFVEFYRSVGYGQAYVEGLVEDFYFVTYSMFYGYLYVYVFLRCGFMRFSLSAVRHGLGFGKFVFGTLVAYSHFFSYRVVYYVVFYAVVVSGFGVAFFAIVFYGCVSGVGYSVYSIVCGGVGVSTYYVVVSSFVEAYVFDRGVVVGANVFGCLYVSFRYYVLTMGYYRYVFS